jgi:hypothetical protein
MPILSKKQQAKAAAKRAANPLPLPKPVETVIVEQTPERTPEQSCGEDDDCLCCQERYVAPAETPEQVAEREARYAADGRSPSGVLVNAVQELPAVKPVPYHWEGGFWLQRTLPHTPAECQSIVDVFGAEHGADLILYDNEGWSFDQLFGLEMQIAHEQWCAVHNAMAASIKAAEDARIAANWQRCVVEQNQLEARRNLKKGQAVQKNGRVCTRCYSCEGDKHTDWEDGGKKARPSTLGVSSECFTHREFLAGRIREDCPFLHQGDAGWHAQWSKNFLWDPSNPQVMPVAKHIRKRQGDAKLCISEKSAGYLPVHLGGKAEGTDARTWRQQTPAAAVGGSSAAVGGGGAAAAPSRWAALGSKTEGGWGRK